MEHFILFAIALIAIAFLSAFLAKPHATSGKEDQTATDLDAGFPFAQLNYIPATVGSRLPLTPSITEKQDFDIRLAPDQLTNLNELVHEKNWI